MCPAKEAAQCGSLTLNRRWPTGCVRTILVKGEEVDEVLGRDPLGCEREATSQLSDRLHVGGAGRFGVLLLCEPSQCQRFDPHASAPNLSSRESFGDDDVVPGQSNKLQKFKLRAPFWEGHDRQVN